MIPAIPLVDIYSNELRAGAHTDIAELRVVIARR